MLDDANTKLILEGGEFTVSLNTKFQLLIKGVAAELPAATEE